jgi:competence protein ComEA
MIARIAVVVAGLCAGAVLLWHPAPRTPIVSGASGIPAAPPDGAHSRPFDRGRAPRDEHPSDALVVYVAGAVRRPGLYKLRTGDRAANAVALAGGITASADASGVNLAQRTADGDEVYVPRAGETNRRLTTASHRRRPSQAAPPIGSVDVNRSDAGELAAVPGIGRSIAARIVELRQREGSFASLDELLDVAGMTQTRLERARPYLREP